MTVLTGVSGSGKSTLAFDIVFAEGQRRYLESLNAYARQFVQPAGRPDVDAIFGIPPTVAIEQRTSRGGRKSTVGTLTEVHHFLRLLYVKLGTQHCPDCDVPIEPQSADAIVARLQREARGRSIALLAPLVVARKGYYTDLAKWAAAKGYDRLRVDGEYLPTAKWPRLDRFREHTIELPVGELVVAPKAERELREHVQRALDFGKGVLHVLDRGRVRVFSTRRACPSCGRSFAEPDPRLFSYNSKHGWCVDCFGTGVAIKGFDEEQTGEEIWWNEWFEGEATACAGCDGQRLNPEALGVRFRGRSIAALAALPVDDARGFFDGLVLAGREREIARDLTAEIHSRLAFLQDVGLGYISLDRAAPTLSGGEAQRIRLAAQLGSNLQGVCYVLDEPTIGLHPRDNRVLLDSLAKLGAKGNTLLVVEHDEDTIRRADHLIDLGPGAGTRGGRVVGQGSMADLIAAPESLTGRFLAQPLLHPIAARRPVRRGDPALDIEKAALHNLRKVNARIPLAAPHGRDRSVGIGQVDARPRRAVRQPEPQGRRETPARSRAGLGRMCGHLRSRAGDAGARGGPDADRTHAALLSRDLRRVLGRDPQAFRRGHRVARPRLRPVAVLVQHGRRTLRFLRRAGRADDRDELPAEREGALRRVPREAVQRRDAGDRVPRPQHRRRAGDERGRWPQGSSRHTRASTTHSRCSRTSGSDTSRSGSRVRRCRAARRSASSS